MRHSVGTRAEALVGEQSHTCPPILSIAYREQTDDVRTSGKYNDVMACVGTRGVPIRLHMLCRAFYARQNFFANPFATLVCFFAIILVAVVQRVLLMS